MYDTACKLQQRCDEKTWPYGTREVSIRKQADKVLQFLDKVGPLGDVVANVDQIDLGLAGARINVLLQVWSTSLIEPPL